MNQNSRTIKKSSLWILILFIIGQMGCERYFYNKLIKKEPLHKTNIQARKACPIDGLWKDAYHGYKYRFDKGRFHVENKDFPMVTVQDITWVAPGKYRGIETNWQKSRGASMNRSCTFSVVSKNKLIHKMNKKVRGIYIKVKLDNERWFLDDFNRMHGVSPAGPISNRNPQYRTPAVNSHKQNNLHNWETKNPSITIQNLRTSPSMVKPGLEFDLIVDYKVTDGSTNNRIIPANFIYSIWGNGELIFSSDPIQMKCRNGQNMQKVVNLRAASKIGTYELKVAIRCKNIEKQGSTLLIIKANPPR